MLMSFFMYISLNIYIYMVIPFYIHLESIEFLLAPTPLVQDSGKTRRKAATALSGTQDMGRTLVGKQI